MQNTFSQVLLAWYRQNARQMPWRGSGDPYAVWVSEIMLQQTRVETVIPYFLRWMQRFPTIEALAASDEQQVLNAWEGLGYYSRARSLLKAAHLVANELNGKIPTTRLELERLPGIGRYTAAAISSIAFGQDEVVLDGNVKRVLSRLLNLEYPIDTPAAEKSLWQEAEKLLPMGQAGDFNQAMMDLGATLCLPIAPKCLICPAVEICHARQLGVQDQRPIVTEKKPIPHYQVVAAIIEQTGCYFIQQRPTKGLLGGLWEFPGGKIEPEETPEQALRRELHEELNITVSIGAFFGRYNHAYTHFRVTLQAFHSSILSGQPQPSAASQIAWVKAQELIHYPMGKIDRMISNDLNLKTKNRQ